ncbi:hypothetical protein ABZ714_10195 [Streptomyces sp. NPDC006798]|uniref:hypothetical protein n=1 Tax=Streptomyces sp. NPDC006798 TaxID=3155462 RepID=UPI0034034140
MTMAHARGGIGTTPFGASPDRRTARHFDSTGPAGRSVLTPGMANGPHAVDPTELAALRRYLERVVETRPGPVHTTVAFNAACLGYDTTGDGYGGCALDIDAFPSVTCDGTGAAVLPVGAFVRVETGSEPLYAEIVYREGALPGGAVPGGVSVGGTDGTGERAGGDGTPSVRPELLVPDFTAFGSGLQVETRKTDRLRAHRKWLTEDGHIRYAVRSAPGAPAAARGETEHFVAHLLGPGRDGRLGPAVPAPLARLAGDDDPRRLRAVLHGLLGTVAHALATSDSVRLWNGYALSRTKVAEGLLRDGPLGRSDLGTLANSLVRGCVPSGHRRHGRTGPKTVHTAVGPWLRSVAGAEGQLGGVGYAVAVCRTNLAMGDVVRDTDRGLFPETGVRVALADAFESGGIWRSHHPGVAEQDRAAAGVGAAASYEGARLGGPRVTGDDPRSVRWTFALGPGALRASRAPLPAAVAEELRALGTVNRFTVLEFTHDGEPDPEPDRRVRVAPDRDGVPGLAGVRWPDGSCPGLLIDAEWIRGSTRLTMRTTLLETPVTVDGMILRHRYDPRVLTRYGPYDPRPGPRSCPGRAEPGPPVLVLRAVRRCGLLTEDGHALLDRAALPRAVHLLELDTAPDPGPGGRRTGGDRRGGRITAAELDRAAGELIGNGFLYAAVGSRGADGDPYYPARPSEPPIPLVGYDPDPRPVTAPGAESAEGDETAAPTGTGAATPHLVSAFVRRLPRGSAPSARQQEAYRAYCREVGKADGTDLPPGRTFVGPHYRGR